MIIYVVLHIIEGIIGEFNMKKKATVNAAKISFLNVYVLLHFKTLCHFFAMTTCICPIRYTYGMSL